MAHGGVHTAEKVRREESTIQDVVDASASGNYLCCDCGISFSEGDCARLHEWNEHIPDEAKQDDSGRQTVRKVKDVSAEYVEPRWIIIYDSIGREWTHPKQVEGKKKRICRVLENADYWLDTWELLDEVRPSSENISASNAGGPERWMNEDELRELLEELVEEDRVLRDEETWTVPS